jgi:hypothetical protein
VSAVLAQVSIPESAREHAAEQFYYWDPRRLRWEIIGTHVERYTPVSLSTFGTPRDDLDARFGNASLYENQWIASIMWVWARGRWHHYDTNTSPPRNIIFR